MKKLALIFVLALCVFDVLAKAEVKVDRLSLVYLGQKNTAESGIPGASLGIEDDNTTGRFMHQAFDLQESLIEPNEDAAPHLKKLIAKGHRHIIVDLPEEQIKTLSQMPEAQDVLLYNISSSHDALRNEACSANLLHLLPSHAMKADALAQYFSKKRWQKLFLVSGPTQDDQVYAAAIQRSAKKFGLKIVANKAWQHSFDERRSDEAEVPVFTQGVEYDVLVVLDTTGNFGDYFQYRTWLPRLVSGTHGLIPSAWHPTHEHWGALQLQKRFKEKAQRWMNEKDYAAWLAVRSVGEASSRVHSLEFDKLKAFMRSDSFTLAGFKGVPLSFRAWDGQLRQPVLLAGDHSLIAVSPIEGFLHPKNELDTLGFDQAESQCRPK